MQITQLESMLITYGTIASSHFEQGSDYAAESRGILDMLAMLLEADDSGLTDDGFAWLHKLVTKAKAEGKCSPEV